MIELRKKLLVESRHIEYGIFEDTHLVCVVCIPMDDIGHITRVSTAVYLDLDEPRPYIEIFEDSSDYPTIFYVRGNEDIISQVTETLHTELVLPSRVTGILNHICDFELSI